MKNYLLFFYLLFTSGLNAQGNLQFNQVVTLNGTPTPCVNTNIDTVPAGKVWKIEAWTNNNEVNIYFNNTLYNNHFLAVWGNNNGTQMQLSSNMNPIWLKGGDVISVTISNQFCQARPYFFSILEFNITP
jgi:hypothetical protein